MQCEKFVDGWKISIVAEIVLICCMLLAFSVGWILNIDDAIASKSSSHKFTTFSIYSAWNDIINSNKIKINYVNPTFCRFQFELRLPNEMNLLFFAV